MSINLLSNVIILVDGSTLQRIQLVMINIVDISMPLESIDLVSELGVLEITGNIHVNGINDQF